MWLHLSKRERHSTQGCIEMRRGLCIEHDIVVFICVDRMHKVEEIYCVSRFCSENPSCMMLHFVALALCRGKRSAPSVPRSPATNNRQKTNAARADRQTHRRAPLPQTSKELWETGRQPHKRREAAKCGMKAVISCEDLIRRPRLTRSTARSDANRGRHCKGTAAAAVQRERRWRGREGGEGLGQETKKKQNVASTQSMKAGEIRGRERKASVF